MDIPLYEIKSQVNASNFTDFSPLHAEDYFLAETLQPTTNGVHVNITYQISVKMVYDTYCASEPECTMPMFIQAPPLQNFHKVEAPVGWAPTVFDQANFALPVPDTELRPYQEGPGFDPEAQPLIPGSPPTPPPNYYPDQMHGHHQQRKSILPVSSQILM